MSVFGNNLFRKLYYARNHLTQTQFIAYGFLGIILTGTALLMLPISSRTGEVSSFLNCLFTATSASCVTGLVVYDTWSHWSIFGQLVILTLIQIGGLGFVTIGVFLAIVLRRRIGLKERGLMQESVNTLQIGGEVGQKDSDWHGDMGGDRSAFIGHSFCPAVRSGKRNLLQFFSCHFCIL